MGQHESLRGKTLVCVDCASGNTYDTEGQEMVINRVSGDEYEVIYDNRVYILKDVVREVWA